MPEPLDEIWKLRGCISDLVSLLALPPLWRGGESPAVAGVLSDVLLRMLRLDFIYVHLQEPDAAAASRVLRIAPREAGRAVAVPPEGVAPAPADRAAEVGRMLAPWLAAEAPAASAMVANPVGPGETAIAVVGLGGDDRCGVLVAGAQREGFPSYIETLLLRVAATQAMNELQGARMRAERSHGREARRQLLVAQAENRHLRRELDSHADLGELALGQCDGLKSTWAQAAQAASGPGCVLVLGEPGAGQELVARAVHRFSRRHDQPFVQLRCSGQSPALLEQLLFGQEGGPAPQPGRLELAHGGTLFLDEIGDLPLELQPRLLRVLQDQTFERAGGSVAMRADVRVVAAASRDLRPLVAQQRLRGDLYYRLNAATIDVPPLRAWVDDIPRLVRHFAQRHARRCNKHIATIAPQTLAALRRHVWPGNLHELDNVVARGVMLSAGPQLELQLPEPVHLAEPGNGSAPCGQPRYVTLEDAQREHIVRALAASNWVIAGAAGAAAKLGMKRTSLQYKMHKLGITRPQVQGARAG